MATITEDYVSFEIAKILKEKGFDSVCENQYINCSSGHPFLTNICDDAGCYYKNSEIGNDEYSAPTLQMAMKWLREVHNIHIVLSPNKKMNNQYCSIIFVDKEGELHPQPTDFFHGSYGEAAEIAIKYCLENLI